MTESQQPARKPLWQRINKLFLLVVIIPTLVSSVYFGLIASDVYISQSKFIIYNPQSASPVTGITGLLEGVGIGNNTSYASSAVHDYLLSRDALSALQGVLPYRKMVSSQSIDPFSRFGGWIWYDRTFEQLYRYYNRMTDDTVDTSSNISTLNVNAYTASDAQKINQQLLIQAQILVNEINKRADRAIVRFYEKNVRLTEAKAKAATEALAHYRNTAKVFSPAPEANIQAQLVQRLQDQKLAAQVQLGQMIKSTPKNPRVSVLKNTITALRRQIDQQTAKIVGNSSSLASKSAQYERLRLSQSFAEKELAAALSSLELAQIEAQKQQLFIETIVAPNKPDEALEPERIHGILATLIVSLLLWGVLSVVIGGIREHHDR